MSFASSPPEGDEIHGPGLPKRIRLSEVGEIAAERLEGGANGSLKEALALRDPSPTAQDAQAERIESEPVLPPLAGETRSQSGSRSDAAAGEPWATDAGARSGPVEPAGAVAAGETVPEAPASASAGDASKVPATAGGDERADQPPDLAVPAMGDGAEASSIPALSPDGRAAEAGTQREGGPPEVLPPDPASGADAAGPAAAVESTAFIAPPLFTAEPAPAMQSFAEAHGEAYPAQTAAEGGDGATPSPSADPRFASALGAAAKLAADATAAAEAIENLKRMLERQLPQSGEAQRQPLHELFGEAAADGAPPPLPLREAVLQGEESGPPAAPAKTMPRPAPREATWRERRQFDVRGFMAGFALSWAIGAALYIYLTAG
jgi:hypothetical protein